jgi:tetratricopeptide (TPR) repeat protein
MTEQAEQDRLSRPGPKLNSRAAQYPKRHQGLQSALIALALIALTLAAYASTLRYGGFVWDDDILLFDNPLIKAGDGLRQFWLTAKSYDYLPLTWTTLWLEWRLWGNHPTGYHVTNVLLHALGAVLLWRLLRESPLPGAALAAAIFAVHPVGMASVAWISERKNTLSMVFFLLTLLAYARFDSGHRKRWYWYVLAILAFAAALLSKAQVIMAPVVLLGLAWWRRNRITARDVLAVTPLLILSAIFAVITIWFQHQRALGVVSPRAEGFFSRLAAAGMIPWFYLYKDFLPVNLTMVYPRWNVDPTAILSYVPGLALLGALAVFWVYRNRWGRPMLAAAGYFVVVLFPVLGFFEMAYHRRSLVADHLQYVALPGPIVLVAAAGWHLAGRLRKAWRIVGGVLAVGVLAALSAMTYERGFVFSSLQAMWTDVLVKNPSCPEAHYERAACLIKEGRLREAEQAYLTAIRLREDYSEAHNNLGALYTQLGNLTKAVHHMGRAVEIRPDNHIARANLARLQYRLGATRDAAENFRQLLKDWPTHTPAMSALARILASDGDDRLRNGPEALTLALESCRLTPPGDPGMAERLHTLAMAYAETGQFDRAIQTARTAADLAERAGFHKLRAEILECLSSYEIGEPVRIIGQPASTPSRPASEPDEAHP